MDKPQTASNEMPAPAPRLDSVVAAPADRSGQSTVGESRGIRGWRMPLALGVAGWLAVVLTRTHPGVTSDESFNVSFGKEYLSAFFEQGLGFFSAESIDRIFGGKEAHQHPPLGRWIIAWVHWLQDSHRHDRTAIDLHAARVAPATAFAIVIVLVARAAARYGTTAGVVAGVAVLVMPRLFAHAHFAALDTMMSWTYLMAVLSAGWMMAGARPWLRAPVAGLLLGSALLMKLHGILLLPLVGVWAVLFYRWKSLLPLVLWGACGVAVFVAGWPWLWSDVVGLWRHIRGDPRAAAAAAATVQPPAELAARSTQSDSAGPAAAPARSVLPNLRSFLQSGVDRATIHVTYAGRAFRDVDVPWHYPWVMFAVTVPLGLHLLGLCGLAHHLRRDAFDAWGNLCLAAVGFPMLVFSLPGVPVYDGVRLFLMVFPAWAIVVGRGAGCVFDWLSARSNRRWAAAATGVFVLMQVYGVWHYHPFQLSYYNALAGGIRGAERLGFEITYWGDAVTPQLVDRWSEFAPPGACAVLAPTLYRDHELLYATARMTRKDQKLVPSLDSPCPYVIVYNRQAYLSDELRALIRDQSPIVPPNAVDGVILGAAYSRRPPPAAGARVP